MCEHIESHSEEQILKGCISLIDEMVGNFREYLEFIGHEPEFEEEKQPFHMSYFHIASQRRNIHQGEMAGAGSRAWICSSEF